MMQTITGIVSVVLKHDQEKGSVFVSAQIEGPNGLEAIVLGGNSKSLKAGDAFRAEGIMSDNPRGGRKFTARMLRPDIPVSEAGARRWLTGVFKQAQHGIRAADLERLIVTRGVAALEQAILNPEILVGMSSDPARFRGAILRDWEVRTSARRAACVMEESGLPNDIVEKVLRAFPDDVYKHISSDPFVVAPIPDVGFANADKLGKRLGLQPFDRKRLEAAAAEVLRTVESSGSTAARLDTFLTALVDTCSLSKDDLQTFVLDGSKHGGNFRIFRLNPGVDDLSGVGITTLSAWNAENKVAHGIAACLREAPRLPVARVEAAMDMLMSDPKFARFDAVQKLAVVMAASEPFSILTGGPGTGKSTVMEAVALLHAKLGSRGRLFLTAPTSMAAERLHETTGQETSTLQSLLGQRRPERAGMPSTYSFNRSNPLPAGCTVAVDEASMLDAVTMAALMDAMPPDGRVLLVGDHNQLPSVGAGNVLADLLSTRIAGALVIPSVGLVEVYRQGKDSAIAHGAASMREGVTPKVTSEEKDGVSFASCSDEEIAERIEMLICDELAGRQGVDIMRDVAVILPQTPGKAGIHAVNRLLSERLNPSGAVIPGIILNADERKRGVPMPRVGDRIMITDTDKVSTPDGGEVKITNGESGVIVGVQGENNKTLMRIRTTKGKEFLLPSWSWRSHVALSYAMTVHKSQGSQYEHIIMGFAEEHRHMMERALAYTGWTRAKKRWHGFGSLHMFDTAIKTWKGDSRVTTLPLALRSIGAVGFAMEGRPNWEVESRIAADKLGKSKSKQPAAAFRPTPLSKPARPAAHGLRPLPPFMLKSALASGVPPVEPIVKPEPSRFANRHRKLGSLGRPIPAIQVAFQPVEDADDEAWEP